MGKSHPHMALYYLYGTVPPCRAPDIFVDPSRYIHNYRDIFPTNIMGVIGISWV